VTGADPRTDTVGFTAAGDASLSASSESGAIFALMPGGLGGGEGTGTGTIASCLLGPPEVHCSGQHLPAARRLRKNS
jgi:hypothetical protein